MHTLRHRNPIGRDDVQFERVLIDLGQQRRSRDGEHKRCGRGTGAREGCGLFAYSHQIRLTCESMDRSAHLVVGGQLDRDASILRSARSHLPHFCMLMDSGHRQAGRQQIQPPDALLEGRVHGRRAAVAAMRHTGHLTSFAGPLDEARER